MRHFTLAMIAGVLWMGSAVAATDAPATQPDSSALVSVPTPTTAPAPTGSILVLPFAQTLGTNYPWLSRAFQQDLQVELSRSTHVKVDPTRSSMGSPADPRMIVRGQYQVTGDQISISGSILDANGKSGGTFQQAALTTSSRLKIRSPVFAEAPFGMDHGRSLPPVNAVGEASGEPTPANTTVITTMPQYYSYTYPSYAAPPPAYPYYYYDPYPYNWYTVPYYGPDIYFLGGWGFYSHHFWDHHWGGFHDGGLGGHVGVGGHVGGGRHVGGSGTGVTDSDMPMRI